MALVELAFQRPEPLRVLRRSAFAAKRVLLVDKCADPLVDVLVLAHPTILTPQSAGQQQVPVRPGPHAPSSSRTLASRLLSSTVAALTQQLGNCCSMPSMVARAGRDAGVVPSWSG